MDKFFATVLFFPPESLVKGIFVNQDAYHGRVGHYVLRQPGGR